MANFLPLKRYMFHCLDRMIEQYGLRGPFLEIGCGRGDVSAHLAARGWPGSAVDFSDAAIAEATVNLAPFPAVAVKRQALAEVKGSWPTIILWDVLEHIDDDAAALADVRRLLEPGGQAVIAVPSNPHEWRWDDDFYGHFRRYTADDLSGRLTAAGLEPRVFWDFTFPVFWAMRRLYTRIKSAPKVTEDKEAATRASATRNAWHLPFLSTLLDRTGFLWWPIYRLQFALFRNATDRGHEFFALARRPAADKG